MRTAQIRHGLNQEYALDVKVQEEGDPDFNIPAQAFGPAKAYRDLGYHIYRHLISPILCDALIREFKYEVKPYPGGLFRQISMLKVPHKIKHGLMVNGFLNTQDLAQFPNFQANSIQVISTPKAQWTIADLTGRSPMLIESTFWETTTTGTPLHRDGDYVNSAIWNTLTGMWVALEDIGPKQGPFCLVPRSHRPEIWNGKLDDYNNDKKEPTFHLRDDLRHRFEQGKMLHYAIQEAKLPVIAPMLNKGDAIFWDGKIIHGSMPPDPGETRYSIAGHYIPSDDALIKHGRLVEFECQVVNGMKLRIIPEATEVLEER